MKQLLSILVTSIIVASTAQAASVSLFADQAVYNIGDTVTLTVTVTANSGETSTQVFGAILFSNPALVSSPVATQAPLESFGGALPWVLGTNPCNPTVCTVMNQIGALTPFTVTNTPLAIAIVTFTYAQVGVLDIQWDPSTFDFFGVTNLPGTSIAVVPEPASVGLLALGLVGLAAARRQRVSRNQPRGE